MPCFPPRVLLGASLLYIFPERPPQRGTVVNRGPLALAPLLAAAAMSVAPQPFCGRRKNGAGTDIHQHPPAPSLSNTTPRRRRRRPQVMDNNGSEARASERRRGITFPQIKGKGINGCYNILQPGTQTAVAAAVELHYTGPNRAPSRGPGHSSAPRHKGELMRPPSVANQGK